MNFRIIPGRGSAILLESGSGMDSTEWNALAPRLAQETGATVIADDRADAVRGLVFVDPFSVEFVKTFGVDYCSNHPMMGKLPFDASRPETLNKPQRALVCMVGAPDGNLAEKVAVARKAVVPEGIPARVITAGIAFLPKPEEQKDWRESHERLSASMKGATMVVAEKSGHMIPFSQPELLVSVASEIVRLAK